VSESGFAVVTLVCEGDTDVAVLSALAEALTPGDVIVDCVQPERPLDQPARYGELGSGWEGVRRWCERQRQRFGGLPAAMDEPPLAGSRALVVHVDADIADHPDVNCSRPCPPASDTADALREFVLREWCAEERLPARVVLCVPSKSTEAWVLVALYPDDRLARPDIECRPEPETLLKQRPERLVSGPENRKNTAAYRAAAPRVAESWPRVGAICTQAERFDRELRAALDSAG